MVALVVSLGLDFGFEGDFGMSIGDLNAHGFPIDDWRLTCSKLSSWTLFKYANIF